ncbi:hypothetical protein GCM10010320_67920 [Streptomyces caelestis]|nr:hypothetical protein GCM10010320_67920 [Streptomyces caelestis]
MGDGGATPGDEAEQRGDQDTQGERQTGANPTNMTMTIHDLLLSDVGVAVLSMPFCGGAGARAWERSRRHRLRLMSEAGNVRLRHFRGSGVFDAFDGRFFRAGGVPSWRGRGR